MGITPKQTPDEWWSNEGTSFVDYRLSDDGRFYEIVFEHGKRLWQIECRAYDWELLDIGNSKPEYTWVAEEVEAYQTVRYRKKKGAVGKTDKEG